MQTIHASTVKFISSELKKCTLGEKEFMLGTAKTGGDAGELCHADPSVLAQRAKDGIWVMSKHKNPW